MFYTDGDEFERSGHTFRVAIHRDSDHGAPWDEEDGHGPVSDWRRPGYTGHAPKAPGERELCNDRDSARFYDFAEAIKIAKRDGWGMSDIARTQFVERNGREPTAGEVAVWAVEQDFDCLRRWCNDDWHYIGIVVERIGADGEPTGERESLWGIASDDDAYITEVAHDLADEIIAGFEHDAAAAAEASAASVAMIDAHSI